MGFLRGNSLVKMGSPFNALLIKEEFSDSNNIILWHESEDINKERLFPKFRMIQFLRFQVMHEYMCFIASHRLLCWIKSRQQDFLQKLLSFHTEMIAAYMGKCAS